MLNWLIYFVDRSMANVLDRAKTLQEIVEIALELKEERKKNEKLRLRRDTNKVRGL